MMFIMEWFTGGKLRLSTSWCKGQENVDKLKHLLNSIREIEKRYQRQCRERAESAGVQS